MADCDAYEYFNENSAFILTLVGLFGAGCSGFAMCILRSRCSHIKCGCISCERNVLSEQAITELAAHDTNA